MNQEAGGEGGGCLKKAFKRTLLQTSVHQFLILLSLCAKCSPLFNFFRSGNFSPAAGNVGFLSLCISRSLCLARI